MIGDLIYDFLTKALEEMKQPAFQASPYPLKEGFMALFDGIAFYHTVPGWRTTGAAATMLDQNEFERTVAGLLGPCSPAEGAPSQPETGAPEKSLLAEAIENLVSQGEVEVARYEDGKPLYHLTELGFARHALETRRPIDELRALPELTRRAGELWPSLRRDRRTTKLRKGD